MNTIVLMAFAYILGSIPNALWIGKVFKGIDVREHGSKNTGSTNAARVLGAKLGILTLILDISKGIIVFYEGRFTWKYDRNIKFRFYNDWNICNYRPQFFSFHEI